MPSNAYITVTLKKETVKMLVDCKANQPLSKVVTDAIYEYVNLRKNSIPTKMTVPIKNIFEITQSKTVY